MNATDTARTTTATRLPVVISIATVPSRIAKLRPTIDSLLNGTLVPDRILIVHPEYCKWEKSGYEIPDFLADPDYCRGIVAAVRSDEDWGPGTKILGALDYLPKECYLVLADDDVTYHPHFLQGLIEAQERDHSGSFSYYTYRRGGLRFGQGCDGYSFYSPNLAKMKEFAEQHVAGTTLLYHDDQWIAFYLFREGVTVRSVPLPVPGQLVYEQVLANDILSSQTSGDLAREKIYTDNLRRLIRTGGLKPIQRLQRRALSSLDFLTDLPKRIKGRLKRLAADSV